MASPHVRHYSLRTEQAEIHWIKLFIFFHHKRQPVEMGKGEFEQFLSMLAVDKQVSASTQKQALNALLFLYRHVLVQEVGWLDNSVVSLRVTAFEREVCEHVKRAGGVWKPASRVWALRYDQVVLLELEERIMAAHSI